MEELRTRLGKSPVKRGTCIFLPRFILFVLKYMNSQLHNISGINVSRVWYVKSMSKVFFDHLDLLNLVDAFLVITPHMSRTFEGYQRK